MFYNVRPQVVIVDDFLAAPDHARHRALDLAYVRKRSKGLRSTKRYNHPEFIPVFEDLLKIKIKDWHSEVNGCYQYCVSDDPVVFHCDLQDYAGAIYLTPDAPIEAGTRLLRSKKFGLRHEPTAADAREHGRIDPERMRAEVFPNHFDPTLWETVDQIGNVYNRLALWPGKHFHAASCYFGSNINDARLFQVFFFNAE